jgi:molybdopterin synthase sulfur carrier subunit
MKIFLFGVLADAIGHTCIEMESIHDVDALKQKLVKDFPMLENYKYQLAINKSLADKNISLREMDEIALLPPFAGG